MPKDKSREMNIIKPVNEHLLNRPFLYSTHQLKADKRMIVSEFNNYLSRRVPYSAEIVREDGRCKEWARDNCPFHVEPTHA